MTHDQYIVCPSSSFFFQITWYYQGHTIYFEIFSMSSDEVPTWMTKQNSLRQRQQGQEIIVIILAERTKVRSSRTNKQKHLSNRIATTIMVVSFINTAIEGPSNFKSKSFVVVIWGLCSVAVIGYLSGPLDAIGAGPPPDLRFGYTYQELKDLLEAWGEDGRSQYVKVALFDMGCYIPAYVMMFGILLFNAIEKASWSKSLMHIVPLITLADYVETIAQLYLVAISFPELDPMLVAIGSIANQIKWSLAGILILQVLCGFAIFGKPSSKEDNKPKQK